MSIHSVVRFLVPNEHRFYGFLEKQGELSLDGALGLARIVREAADPGLVREAV